VTAVTGVLFDNASFFGQRTLAVDERLSTHLLGLSLRPLAAAKLGSFRNVMREHA
jgi:hypothetical protein